MLSLHFLTVVCVVNKYCAWFVLVSMGLGLDYEVNFAGISVAVRCGLVAVRGEDGNDSGCGVCRRK